MEKEFIPSEVIREDEEEVVDSKEPIDVEKVSGVFVGVPHRRSFLGFIISLVLLLVAQVGVVQSNSTMFITGFCLGILMLLVTCTNFFYRQSVKSIDASQAVALASLMCAVVGIMVLVIAYGANPSWNTTEIMTAPIVFIILTGMWFLVLTAKLGLESFSSGSRSRKNTHGE